MRRAKNSLTHNIQPGNVCHESALLTTFTNSSLCPAVAAVHFFFTILELFYILSMYGQKDDMGKTDVL
jgi:hypothetical protein